MAGSSLYDIVQGKKSTNKRRVGYTVSAYAGVLSALKNANSTNSNNQSSSNSLLSGDVPQETVVSHSYSFLGSHSGEIVFNPEGFSITEGLNQISVKLSTFMACPVIVNIDGKSYSEIATNNAVLDVDSDGKCLVDGRYFLSNKFDKDTHVIDSTGHWCVGVGVPMVQTAMSYFNHFYNKIKCFNDSKKGILEKIAGEGLLYAEVMLPMSKNEYKVVHCKVIHDVKNATNTSNFMVYMPIPLLMLDDYKGIGDIIVSYSNTDMTKPNFEEVNKDNVKFEFRNKNFNHKEAKIEGFTVDDIGKHYYSNNNDVAVDVEQWKRNSQFGNARFYFSDQDKGRIQEILEEEIPEEYQESLFRGVLTEDQVYRTLSTTVSAPTITGNENDTCLYQTGQVDWDWVKNSKFKNYYEYKSEIEDACAKNNLNTRMVIAHSAWETGYLKSKGWKDFYNPGGILWSQPNAKIRASKYGNVECKASDRPSKGSDGRIHGYFVVFNNARDAFYAKTYLIANSSNYGVKTFSLKTVKDYANAMENGVNGKSAYCYKCPNYANNILKLYNEIKSK